MGFRFKRFDYAGGMSVPGKYDWSSNSTPLSRSQGVLLDFGKWIINDSGLHWTIDTVKHPSYDENNGLQISDFVPIQGKYNSTPLDMSTYGGMPGLFLTNTTSGCKLFICVFGEYLYRNATQGSNCCINVNYADIVRNGQYDSHLCGIIASIIPGGSGQSFGSVEDGTLLPSHATRLVGTIYNKSSDSYMFTYIGNNQNGYNYTYGMFLNDCCIGIGGGYRSDGGVPSIGIQYFTGRIFNNVSHSLELPTDLYGNFCMCSNYSYNTNTSCEFNTNPQTWQFISSPTNVSFFGTDYERVSQYIAGSLFRAYDENNSETSGAPIITNNNNYCMAIKPSDAQQLTTYVSNYNVNEELRWTPAEVAICSNDLSTYYITPGNGIKGYLDTSMFRYAISTKNVTYGNKSFISAGYNFLVGWDPSNTDALV